MALSALKSIPAAAMVLMASHMQLKSVLSTVSKPEQHEASGVVLLPSSVRYDTQSTISYLTAEQSRNGGETKSESSWDVGDNSGERKSYSDVVNEINLRKMELRIKSLLIFIAGGQKE